MNSSLSVLIVDDHPIILEGIRSVLAKEFTYAKIVAVPSYLESLSLIQQSNFDIYIIDIELTHGDGFILIEQIRHIKPDARVIVNTMHDELWTIRKLIDSNVDAVILKTSDCSQLNNAINAVLEGKSYFCRHFMHLNSRINALTDKNISQIHLSERELDVLYAIVDGNNSAEIAERLFLSVNTIESHRRRILSKLDAKNVAELVAKAIKLGIVTIKHD